MEDFQRTFKGEVIKDFTEKLKDMDIGIKLMQDIKKNVDGFTKVSRDIAKETDDLTKNIMSSEEGKNFELIKNSIHQFLDIGISIGALSAITILNKNKIAQSEFSNDNLKKKNNNLDKQKENESICVKKGSSISIPFNIENNSETLLENITFISTPLICDRGYEINNNNITFTPNGLTIFPNDVEKPNIIVSIPKNITPGKYRGNIIVENNKNFKLPYEIEVM